ncbi:hypothetical protein [Paraferrimonas sp. SM1919]|uniref:hypothetical protein n=1 Tax=Paraferrimonas sp. SM1919 TaxID=2662263 RepID=UPI0013D2DF72|nr:hypothetical protein [Paraferrimonas sp. SM1919]
MKILTNQSHEALYPREYKIVANHTCYDYPEAANFEYGPQNQDLNAYSGTEDQIFSEMCEHENWQEGYDY